MNYRVILHYTGQVLKLEAVFLMLPLAVSLYFRESEPAKAILLTVSITLLISLSIQTVRRGEKNLYAKDGFVLVSACWISISIFGALPFYLSGAIPDLIESLFESISGFTTTGASILGDVETLPRGLLLWRSLTHWIGGMGVLVFLLAVTSSNTGERSVYVMKAESPGPSPGKLVPRLRQSSMILYAIYLALTLIQLVFLLFGGMPLFDSVCIAMSTAGTGGFAVTNSSIAAYNSLYIEVVITIFMVLFGVNFNAFYYILIRNFKGIWRSDEIKAYLGIILASTLVIALNLTGRIYAGFGDAFRYAAFHVGSVISTTGFATADFALWPEFSRMVLLTLMFTGGCAGSTSGGLKVSRVLILLREAKRLLTRMAHPRSVEVVKLDGKSVEKETVYAVSAYVITFMLLVAASMVVVALDDFDFETTFTAVIACLSNVGPGLSKVSPSGNFHMFSTLSKLVLLLDMLIGRLEIYPILLLFTPRMWRKV